MDKQELYDLIDDNIKSNSNRISPDKTTGTMLKKVLTEIVNSLADSTTATGDDRYHTKIKGEIKMYWGNYFELPKGWVICDGYNGTPDLRGKVPVGWSNGWSSSLGEPNLTDYQHIGRMGGKRNLTLEKTNLPDYEIPNSLVTTQKIVEGKYMGDDGNGFPDGSGNTTTAGSETSYVRDSEDLVIPPLEVTGSINLDGDSTPMENRSPYIVMMYIMYVGKTISSGDKVAWTEYDGATGAKILQGDSNSKYGFRYISPANFSNTDPSSSDNAQVISNLGFTPEGTPERILEFYLQLVSKGDNLGDDSLKTVI